MQGEYIRHVIRRKTHLSSWKQCFGAYSHRQLHLEYIFLFLFLFLFLKLRNQLEPHLREVILYALALVAEGQGEGNMIETEEALTRLFRHLNGLGHYGDTAFLTALYGAGEILQAFCRTSAVWGGTYILQSRTSKVVLSEKGEKVVGIMNEEGQVTRCGALVCGKEYIGGKGRGKRVVRRRISILDSTAFKDVGRAAGSIPPGTFGNEHPIQFVQNDWSQGATPEGLFLLHVSTISDRPQELDGMLKRAAQGIYEGEGMKVHEVFAVEYEEPLGTSSDNVISGLDAMPDNFLLAEKVGQELYLYESMMQAKALFERLYPGLEFLPAEPQHGMGQVYQGTQEDEDAEILEATFRAAHLVDSPHQETPALDESEEQLENSHPEQRLDNNSGPEILSSASL